MSKHHVGSNITSRPRLVPRGAILTVTPDVGATAVVQCTSDNATNVANGVATWTAWPLGSVTGKAAQLAGDNLFVRITSTGGLTNYEINEAPSSADVAAYLSDWSTNSVAGTTAPTIAIQTALPTFSKALAELAAGVGMADVPIVGDSLSVGQFAESTAFPNAATASLARLLAGLTGGTDNATFGGIQLGDTSITNMLASDPRITQGAGSVWETARVGAIVFGTTLSYRTGGTGAPLTFTPADPWDTVDIHFISNTTYGTCAVTGAVTGTVNATAALDVKLLRLTKTHGAGAVTLTPTGEIHIVGINCYSKTVPRLNFLKMGVGSSTVANWTDNTGVYKSQQALQKYMAAKRPHLWLVQLGTNDMLTSVPVADYKTNMQTLITNLKRSDTNVNGGDVVLLVPPPIPFGSISEAIQATFREAIYALAETNRLLVIDNYVDYVSPTYGASKGWYSAVQGVHLNASGYAELAANIRKSLGLK